MKIGVLSYTTVRRKVTSRHLMPGEKLIAQAVKAAGHTFVHLRADKCEMSYDRDGLKLLYAGRTFPKVDVVIPRPAITLNAEMLLTLSRHFELMGIPMINSYEATLIAKSKHRTAQILSQAHLPIPRTVVLRRLDYLDDAIKKVGGFPVILKTPASSLGKGVVIMESKRSMLSSLDMILSQKHWEVLLIQEYIKESEGKDIRVFVVNGKVIAAMQRSANPEDFRSNLHRGGVGELTELSKTEQDLALRATQVVGLDYAGVDLLRTKNGPVVMEINANAGLEGITAATGIDVAGAIVDFAVQRVSG